LSGLQPGLQNLFPYRSRTWR